LTEPGSAAGDPVKVNEPPQNLLIQNPSALTTSGQSNTAAVAFYHYLYSSAGQAIWLLERLRSTLSKFQSTQKDVFYTPKTMATASQLGGWTLVTYKYFAPSTVLVTKIENAHGYTS